MFGPRDGGCLAVATEAPPYPPGTIKHNEPKTAEATPAGINQRTGSNRCECDGGPALGTGTETKLRGETG
eukprot:2954937-Lingulodinium_polyedra.AAC.1